MRHISTRRVIGFVTAAILGMGSSLVLQQIDGSAALSAQGKPPSETLGNGRWLFKTREHPFRVSRIATLSHPWSIAFLPDGGILVTERPGRLRRIRNGVLDPQPIAGLPAVHTRSCCDGLLDIALHPKFGENQLVYLTYSKPGEDGSVQTALFRGRLNGMALVDGRDIFVANTPIPLGQQGSGSRVVFGHDGMLYMSVGSPGAGGLVGLNRLQAQNPASHRGKILRLRDDGTAPPDNPFVGKSTFGVPYQPEIYSMGHRNPIGLAVNPENGEIWEAEDGPFGGDELNKIEPGHNYGWPVISLGREYNGTPMPPAMDGMDQPIYHWVPSIATAGISFYAGEMFPKWKRSIFIAGLAGKQISKLTFNEQWQPIRIEPLLLELRQRIRDVKESPQGLLYVLTDEEDGAVLVIEPVTEP